MLQGSLSNTIPVRPVQLTAKAIFRCEARVLVLRKLSGNWDLPGGRMEPGETLEQTLAREVFEETGFRAPAARLAGQWLRPRAGKFDVLIHFFMADVGPDFFDGLTLSDEHDEARLADLWQIGALPFPEGYRRVLQDVLSPRA